MRQLNIQIESLRQENASIRADESLKKRNNELMKSIETLKKENQKQTVKENQFQQKSQEVYNLTVELGSIREENNELKRNLASQKDDY